MAQKFLTEITLQALNNATTDTDKFLVSDSGTIKFRTGAQVLSDIGGQAALTNPVTGTGTTNYVPKFTGTTTLGNSQIIDNGFSVKYQNKAYYNTIQSVGTLGTVKWILQDSNGNNVTTSSTNKVYRIQLVTTPTGTNTGATWIASNVDAAGWNVKVVNANTVSGSNYPYMIVDTDGLPKVTMIHPNNYNVSISVEEFDGTNNGTTTGVFGLDDSITAVGGSIGIGTTTPGYTLDVNGVIRTLTGYIIGANSSADINIDGNVGSRLRYANQSITFDSSNATIKTNNIARLFINNAGNVGIGTTSPGVNLQVAGSGETSIDIQDTGGQQYRMFSRNYDKVFGFYDVTVGRTFFRFTGNATASNNKLSLLESGGEVLIGTTTGGGTSYGAQPQLTVASSTGGVLDVRSLSTDILSGNVIGKIQFTGKDDATVGYTTAAIQALAGGTLGTGNGPGILQFLTNPGGGGSSPAERMRIASGGNVGIGTTNPTSKLHSVVSISGPVSYDSLCAIFGYNTSTDTIYNNQVGIAGRVLTSGGKAVYGDATTGGGWGGYFDGKGYFSGRVGIGTTTSGYPLQVATQVSNISIYANYDVVAFSDKSVKENIRPIENVIERIQNSRGVVYDRIDSGAKDNIGFIAQELEENFPELVTTNEDGTKAVKYQNTVAVLFEAVKEQQKQIDELKQIINGITK